MLLISGLFALLAAGAAVVARAAMKEGPVARGPSTLPASPADRGMRIPSIPPGRTVIRTPAGPPVVVTDKLDALGRPVVANCASCHATREPNLANAASADLDEFHVGLSVKHGELTCLSCHNPGDYESLRKADGKRVEFTDVMSLCAQCHGPQYRDYQHGAHGGMTGHWDLSKGGRARNNCVDCHDPHAPAYRGASPVLKPRDRFLTPGH